MARVIKQTKHQIKQIKQQTDEISSVDSGFASIVDWHKWNN